MNRIISVFDFMTEAQRAAVQADDYTTVTAGEITSVVQAALDAVPFVNNAGGSNAGGGTVMFPSGRYRISQTLAVRPATVLAGEGMDATQLIAEPSLAAELVQFHRPASVLSSFTRRYAVRHLGLIGVGTAGSVGISFRSVAEIACERVLITSFDKGLYFYDTIVGKIDCCKVHANLSCGLHAEYRTNAIEVGNGTRIQSTASGPNVLLDGPDSFGWLFAGAVIESAGTLDAANGHGIWIGKSAAVKGVTIAGCFFEANARAAVMVGDIAAPERSVVDIVGGVWSTGASPVNKTGVLVYGGYVHCHGFELDSFGAAARIVIEKTNGGIAPRIFNLTESTISSSDPSLIPGAGSGYSFDDNYLNIKGIRFGGRTSDNAWFVKRANDVAYQGVVPLWVQQELRTKYQGSGVLSAGSLSVTFETPATNASYLVLVTTEGPDHVRAGFRTTTGFKITSGNAADASRVYWLVLRNQ